MKFASSLLLDCTAVLLCVTGWAIRKDGREQAGPPLGQNARAGAYRSNSTGALGRRFRLRTKPRGSAGSRQ